MLAKSKCFCDFFWYRREENQMDTTAGFLYPNILGTPNVKKWLFRPLKFMRKKRVMHIVGLNKTGGGPRIDDQTATTNGWTEIRQVTCNGTEPATSW